MSGHRSIVVGLAAGVLVGVLATAAVVATGWLDRPDPVEGDEAIADFLQAWADHRNGTYVVESTFVRTGAGGNELRSAVRVVQRPPDRVVAQFGGVEAQLEGEARQCLEGADEVLCAPASDGLAYEQAVAREVDVLLGYLVGDPPLYEVSGDGAGCFDLELARDLPFAPYGELARFCFDDETGAMVEARIERPEATDVTEAVDVRGEVRDEDLQVGAG